MMETAEKGNLYRISFLLLKIFSAEKSAEPRQRKNVFETEKIEKALKNIYENYASPNDINYVCKECGYSKSSFCRTFKRVTGYIFHNLLNKHKVEVACLLLKATKHSIEDIAIQTGFLDSKSFCRVFKSFMTDSPGSYRKNHSFSKQGED